MDELMLTQSLIPFGLFVRDHTEGNGDDRLAVGQKVRHLDAVDEVARQEVGGDQKQTNLTPRQLRFHLGLPFLAPLQFPVGPDPVGLRQTLARWGCVFQLLR